MSILIPKMIMPETCGDCPFFMDEDFTWCGRASYYICDGIVDRNGKPEWCDLIEVPPHGRLIDADALVMSDKPISRMMMFGGQFVYSQSEIDDAPTIIEADTCNNLKDTCKYLKDDAVNASIEKTGRWEERIVDDDPFDKYGFFRRRFYCSCCGEWTSYGMPPYCMHCGARMINKAKGNEKSEP